MDKLVHQATGIVESWQYTLTDKDVNMPPKVESNILRHSGLVNCNTASHWHSPAEESDVVAIEDELG